MKAAVFYECGGPDKIEIVDLSQPEIKPNEVLIQIEAAALNHHDLWMLRGPANSSYKFPYCGGSDIAGIVTEVGEEATQISVGERVLVNPNISCGVCQQCLAGEHSLCPDYDILVGGFAEYITVPADKVMAIPDDLSFTEAAAVPLVYQTAWRALISQAQVRLGEDVLILGASGGVASAAIQIAKLAGARVIGVTSTPEKMEKVMQLGADYVVNRNVGDYWSEIRKWTDHRGLDLVVENVGATTWANSIASLVKGGRLVTYGRTTGKIGETDISLLFWNQLRIIGTTMSSNSEFIEVMKLVFQGDLKPVIDSVYPLAEAPSAYAYLSSGKQFGKVVIQIGDGSAITSN
jgi:NADPH:quinone reductase-like Zn-dependent oxidoreductase